LYVHLPSDISRLADGVYISAQRMSKTLQHLLLSVFVKSLASRETIDLEKKPHYLHMYGTHLVDFDTCDGFDFLNYVDEYGNIPDDECHVSNLEEDGVPAIIQQVKSCCPSPATYLGSASCQGKDRDGRPVDFSNVDLCASHEEVLGTVSISQLERITLHPATPINCAPHCQLERGLLNQTQLMDQLITNLTTTGNKSTIQLIVEGENLTEFCLTRACSHDGEEWHYHYQACGRCRSRSIEENNALLDEKFPDVPLCCGQDGILDVDKNSCSNSQPLPQAMTACNWRNKQSLMVTRLNVDKEDEVENSSTNFICIGSLAKERTFLGAVTCKDDCEGASACFRSCMIHDKIAFDPLKNTFPNKSEGVKDLAEVLGLNATIKYATHPALSPISQCQKKKVRFPEDSCNERVEFKENGSIVFPETGQTLKYGEFCLMPLSDLSRGGFAVKTCKSEGPPARFRFYYIVLSMSIICLAATIFIYLLFRSALLQSEYNKIMINFAISLLLGFLPLVILQAVLPDRMKSKGVCTVIALLNQFFILAAFVWMTLMSYEIFKQIRGMQVITMGQGSDLLRKKVPIGYGIPAFICTITLIVEATAPRCSSIRPRFGHKTCLFYGKLDKFFWLYLPILLLLIVNTIMCGYITYCVFKNRKNDSLAGRKGGRKEKFDQICLYLRLFLGMGVIWYFELVAFAVNGKVAEEVFYLTDTVNMLQGVWVFLTFVCKKNVLKVVTRQRDQLYSQIARTMSNVGSGERPHSVLRDRDFTTRRLTDTTMMSQSEVAFRNSMAFEAFNRNSAETAL